NETSDSSDNTRREIPRRSRALRTRSPTRAINEAELSSSGAAFSLGLLEPRGFCAFFMRRMRWELPPAIAATCKHGPKSAPCANTIGIGNGAQGPAKANPGRSTHRSHPQPIEMHYVAVAEAFTSPAKFAFGIGPESFKLSVQPAPRALFI